MTLGHPPGAGCYAGRHSCKGEFPLCSCRLRNTVAPMNCRPHGMTACGGRSPHAAGVGFQQGIYGWPLQTVPCNGAPAYSRLHPTSFRLLPTAHRPSSADAAGIVAASRCATSSLASAVAARNQRTPPPENRPCDETAAAVWRAPVGATEQTTELAVSALSRRAPRAPRRWPAWRRSRCRTWPSAPPSPRPSTSGCARRGRPWFRR